jgi:hypothetical protein
MAKFNNGIMGPFTGKVGAVIGSSWKGIPYMKKLYKKRTKSPSAGEKANREKFKMAQLWLKPLTDFVRQGFNNYSPTVQGFLAAKSWLLRHSFEGKDPDISINPELVKLSHGTLPLPENIKVEKRNENELYFTWNPAHVPDGNLKDQVMLLAYDLTSPHPAVENLNGQFRETGAEKAELPLTEGKTYHIYFAFVAHDRSRQSDSVYLGVITM